MHANLKFVGWNILYNFLEFFDDKIFCFVGDDFFTQLLEFNVQKLEASLASQLVTGGNLNELQILSIEIHWLMNMLEISKQRENQ